MGIHSYGIYNRDIDRHTVMDYVVVTYMDITRYKLVMPIAHPTQSRSMSVPGSHGLFSMPLLFARSTIHAYTVIDFIAVDYVGMDYLLMSYIVLAYFVIDWDCIVLDYIIMDYIGMDYIVIDYIVRDFIVMAYIVTGSLRRWRCQPHPSSRA